MHDRKKLEEHILSLSQSNNFQVAKSEWVVTDYHFSSGDSCPCGMDIMELCYITNIVNGNTTYVGNVCVKNFLELRTEDVFGSLRRLREEPNKAKPNLALINYAWDKGFIWNAEERDFLIRMSTKRKFSPKQRNWINAVNWRINNGVIRRKPQ